jgi:hypothetical protein
MSRERRENSEVMCSAVILCRRFYLYNGSVLAPEGEYNNKLYGNFIVEINRERYRRECGVRQAAWQVYHSRVSVPELFHQSGP